MVHYKNEAISDHSIEKDAVHPRQNMASGFLPLKYQESNPIMDDSKPDIQLSHFYHMAQKLGSFATVCRYNN